MATQKLRPFADLRKLDREHHPPLRVLLQDRLGGLEGGELLGHAGAAERALGYSKLKSRLTYFCRAAG